ncbi:MAG: DUF5320 domain-containing protein [Bacteroidia bacterium]|nr:DUF5320 domain-containing protein [Bacteroidia bacterium]
MPGHDKTGPSGAGPLSGRRMGLCAGNETTDAGNTPRVKPGFREGNFRGGGRGYGFGLRDGFGRGSYGGRRQSFGGGSGFYRNITDQPISDDLDMGSEIRTIKNQLKELTDQLSTLVKKDKT